MMEELIESAEQERGGVSRRSFIKTAAVVGAGMLAVQAAGRSEAQAAEDSKQAAKKASDAAAGGGAKKLSDVLKVAREKMYPRCRVCPECDGVACSGEVPGMGGIDSGKAFRNNLQALAAYNLRMLTFHEVKKPDTSLTLFGAKLSMPILSGVTGGVTYNMGLGGKVSEEEYAEGIIGGCVQAGTMGFAADGIGDPLSVYETRLKTVAKYRGRAVAQIKPRTQTEIIERIRLLEQVGVPIFALDIDSAGRASRALPGKTVEPKSLKQLREIARSTKLPFVIKGVMTPEEAVMAYEVGAAGIVVSNHGGRVLDHTPGTAQVLPAIADKVKGKLLILADGGVRYGGDVLKMLALGASAVLVGRPLVRGSVGGGAEGVALMLKKMQDELVVAMTLTGTADVKNVSRSIII
ncbi:alpha-hydroxy-acid oxidizing protein [Geobacter sp. SVR]|uniref:alpha-hydroxy-acid oxidizing protein n=1 Tax=Geobacter sp. SVR TaxID=2495594 RepID=UPI00143F014D|nr:alpha-hydroxy-acid oxidizing protein [Geobacter sp. SVR]BCS53510.1 alpha-hydroxy-acid oxidizing enzyme [Geobacter sp. SVR]GCF84293.1 alpha-hydroxy-acid oxidizing enzyme [Geobacter sp. SVR]